MSDLPTPKKAAPRRRKAGATPIPQGPGTGSTCGHEGQCTANACQVTYAGPVSRMHDHHMIVAARGTSHIWPAAVITSLALLITGTIAFTSVNASQDQRSQTLQKQAANRADIDKIVQQLNRIEDTVNQMQTAAQGTAPSAREMLDKAGGLPSTQ